MKKFFVKIIIITLVLLILFTGINSLYINSAYYKNRVIDRAKFRNLPDELDIINLGNSHAVRAIDYSRIENTKTGNLASPGQTLDFDYLLLEKFGPRLSEDATVIINVSHLSFSKESEERIAQKGTRYYRILDPMSFANWTIDDYIMYGLFPVLSTTNKLFDAIQFEKIKETKYKGRLTDYTDELLESELRLQNKQYISKYEFDDKKLEALCSIIEYCQTIDVTPVLVTVPVTDLYHDLFTDEILNDYSESMNYICEKYGIKLHNYTEGTGFKNKHELFYNSNHMNIMGAAIFSDVLFTDLGLVKQSEAQSGQKP